MTHTLSLKSITPVTHDTYHLTFERPAQFEFAPGQAVDMAVDRDNWRDSKHPFTMISLPGETNLEFVIKTYPQEAEGHEGMTQRIAALSPGDKVLIEEPWGAIKDEGKGVFVAGGAGVTPFVSILRSRLAREGTLEGSTLVCSNSTERDIILRDSFEKMPGLHCVFVVTDEPDSPLYREKIDQPLLSDLVTPGRDKCYVCGPDAMLDDMAEALRAIGVAEEDIITEDFG